MRGKCRLCGLDVLDSQPRAKDPATGRYQHQDCRASNGATPPPLSNTTPSASSNVHEVAVSDAKASAAQTAEDARLEVAAIKAAADAARAEVVAETNRVVAEANRQAEAALAQARSNMMQINSATPQSTATTLQHGAARDHQNTSVSRGTISLPAEPKTKRPLLPDGKHAFLSYQWDVQEQVKEIKGLLNERQIKCWMDIDGGMKSDIYDSMAEGVQGAACVVCFMTQAYQDSANCKLELKFAQQSGVPIIPVMMEPNFVAKGWLGILTSGSIWTPMHDSDSVRDGIDKLLVQAQHLVPGFHSGDYAGTDTASEGSDNTESFDVGAWGDAMFSLDEMREELERLREESAPAAGNKHIGRGNDPDGILCSLPAMVPSLPRGLFVTAEMQSVLDAVLSQTSTPQIGFCGMGGIGKTTVSCWVTRNDAVRTKFATVAWITLGQTPVLSLCMDLLHQQIEGSALPDGVSADQKREIIQQSFLNRSVLLILDDCWDAEVADHFAWIDESTNSKVLISSRVRDVLDGGDIIDVTVPSKTDAAKMLLATAGLDPAALQERAEVAYIVELCKRLPLTIGVAGKLIRQLAQGSSMSAASDWAEVVSLLKDEMNDPGGSLSVEESVIRASIKAIPKKIQKQVTQLFHGFALAPEDTQVPLPVLGMIYDACSAPSDNSRTAAKPLSRLQARRCLKVLIDRSLVMGTVDRPQLHDVMLDYVQKQLAGDAYKAAQRRLVELLRKADRSASSVSGKYILNCVQHHINGSHSVVWEKSPQAASWLEDHVDGVQDTIAASAASIMPAERMAQNAEDSGMWWKAALRFNALGIMKKKEMGMIAAGVAYFKRAVAASANVTVGSEGGGGEATRFDIDSFELHAMNFMLKSWDPTILKAYGSRMRKLLATKAGVSRPLMAIAAGMALDWFPALLSGNEQAQTDEMWKLGEIMLSMLDETTDAYAHSTDEERRIAKPMLAWSVYVSHDAISNSPGFSWDLFDANGDTFVDYYNAYSYEEHSNVLRDICSADTVALFAAAQSILTLQYGRVKDARELMEENLVLKTKLMRVTASDSYIMNVCWSACFEPMLYYILGIQHHCRAHFDILGLTFDNVEERLDTLTKPAQGAFYTAMEHKGHGGGVIPVKAAGLASQIHVHAEYRCATINGGCLVRVTAG